MAAEAQRVEAGISETHLWRLLAPGLALLLAMCMVSSRGTATFTPFITASGNLIATVAVKERAMAAYCEPYAYTEHNVWPRTTFGWTNRSRPVTTALSVLMTNQ